MNIKKSQAKLFSLKVFFLFCLLCLGLNIPLTSQALEDLRIGTFHFYPPYIMVTANKQFFGYDVDLMHNVCKLINRRCVFIPMAFNELFTNIKNGSIDVVASAVTITQAREAEYLFSQPYKPSHGSFLLIADSPIKNLAQIPIPGMTIGAIKGSLFVPYLQTHYGGAINLKQYVTLNDLIADMVAKNITIALLDTPAAIYWTNHASGLFRLIKPRFNLGIGIGMMLNKQNVTLWREINNALNILRANGTLDRLFNKYFILGN